MLEKPMLSPNSIFVANLDGTPVVTQVSGLPGFATLGVGAFGAARLQHPKASPAELLAWVIAWFALFEVADTLHTVGHIRSARQVNAPMDKVKLAWGLQSTVYYNANVTPRQHTGRAAGGVLMSTALTISALPFYGLLRRVPILGDLIEIWWISNALIMAGSIMPTPLFDGGSLLKWTTTQRTGEESLGDEAVQQAGSLVIGALLMAMLLMAIRGKWLAAGAALVGAMAVAGDLYLLKGRLPG